MKQLIGRSVQTQYSRPNDCSGTGLYQLFYEESSLYDKRIFLKYYSTTAPKYNCNPVTTQFQLLLCFQYMEMQILVHTFI